ncbi:DUF3561 family protein [Brenneria sp. g21c3]|uniref:DUF3561 family protein n=1 Tax=Brenneria sp. g21c3 TaxID=3093893 RepID=UPI002ECB2381|nr:DUF3561 family protein [Brenneria sp. g21c3]
MQNVTRLTAANTDAVRDDDGVSPFLLGTGAGFCFYCLAFILPFLVYNANAAFFLLLYTWPFFLALMPLSLIIGAGFSYLFYPHIWYALSATALTVLSLVWLTFSLFIGE